jgi:predicted dehydrogenase
MAREHIRALLDLPGVSVVGIHSRTRARAEALAAEFSIPDVYDSIDALAGTGAGLVVVSVPELETNRVCRACFEHPWTALVEKPVGYDVADAEDIEAVATSRGRRAFVALNRRHYASTRAVVADLHAIEGERLIVIQDQQDPLAARKAGQPAVVVKNWMYANSIHVVDYFRVLGRGDVVSVESVIPWDPERPGYVAARVTFASGDIGLYQALWNGPGPWAVAVNTHERRWEMRPLERAAFQHRGSRILELLNVDDIDLRFKPGLRRQAELAVRAASGVDTELPTLVDGLASMRLVQAIYR